MDFVEKIDYYKKRENLLEAELRGLKREMEKLKIKYESDFGE